MASAMPRRLRRFLLLVPPTCTRGLSSSTYHHRQQSLPILFDSTNHLHRDLQYHPEQPARITKCVQALDRWRNEDNNNNNNNNKATTEEPTKDLRVKLIDVANDNPIPVDGVQDIDHQPFSAAELEHARDMLLAAHDDDLVTRFEERCRNSKRRRVEEGKDALGYMGYIDPDTYATTESFDVCLRATAAWIRAVDAAMSSSSSFSDDDDNEYPFQSSLLPVAMALTRPPGHHATYKQSNGFCLYNFAAAAALHAMQKDSSTTVSILDWDVHYGQGVADIMKKHNRSRYVSIHQTPLFPNLGESLKVQGEYKNVLTIPMPADTTWTCGYESLFEKALDFIEEPGTWEPDLVLVCAGYDALASDEMAGTSLIAADYGKMTRRLWQRLTGSTVSTRQNGMGKAAAAAALTQVAVVPVVFGLEGGYQLGPMASGGNLPDAVVETVQAVIESWTTAK